MENNNINNIHINDINNQTTTINTTSFVGHDVIVGVDQSESKQAHETTPPTTTSNTTDQTRARQFQSGSIASSTTNTRQHSLERNRMEIRSNALAIAHSQSNESRIAFDTTISDHFYDRLQYSNMTTAILNTINIPYDIAEQIAEFALGIFRACNGCPNDVSILYKPNAAIFYYNPGTELLEYGHIDVNKEIQVYCNCCVQRGNIEQCNFQIIKPYNPNVINFPDIEFRVLFCSGRFIKINNNDKCNPCRAGRILSIENKRVETKGGENGCSYTVRNGNGSKSSYMFGNGSGAVNGNGSGCILM